MTEFDPAHEGWRPLRGAPLPGTLGTPWARRTETQWLYGLLTTAEHANPNGVVHGGVLMTFADQMLSLIAWEAAERAICTTIQLNTHFLDAIRPGEFVALDGHVTRKTRGLVFVRALLNVDGPDGPRDVGAVDGIWRILRPR